MMSTTKYNGWTNYETWNANLWIDNDWRLSELYAMRAGDLLGSYEADEAVYQLAESIKEYFMDMMPELEPSFYSDVLNASMREVNWYEIAKHYVDAWELENEVEAE